MKKRDRKPEPPKPPEIEPATSLPVRPGPWPRLWATFVKEHREWVNKRLSPGDAAYVLPEEIIKELESSRGSNSRLTPTLGDADAKAERAFARVCQEFHADTIGVWQGGPLQFTLLRGSGHAACFREAIAKVRDGPDADEQRSQIREMQTDRDRIRRQQLAYAGRLSFHPPFRKEVKQLRELWEQLPGPKPIAGPWAAERNAMSDNLPAATLEYYRAYEKFRSAWHLATLVSWDIPWPMGRLEGFTIAELATLIGTSQRVDYYPPYLETPQQSVRDKENLSKAMAQYSPGQPDLPPTSGLVGRGQGPSEYESAFRMLLLELAVHRRYGKRRGLALKLVAAFSELLTISADRVRQLRTIYVKSLTP